MSKNELQAYEVQDLVDSAIASGKWTEHMRSQYVYEFIQRGTRIRGLTAAAINDIATTKFNVTTTDVKTLNIEALAGKEGILGVRYEVWCENVETKQRAYGTAYEPFMLNGHLYKFCWQKAHTKARRNAQKQLIPAALILNAVDEFLTLPETLPSPGEVPPEPVAQPLPIPEDQNGHPNRNDSETDKIMRKAFAIFNQHQHQLKNRGIDKKVFWQAVREQFNVDSRILMTPAQWQSLINDLQHTNKHGERYADWIAALAGKEMPKDV